MDGVKAVVLANAPVATGGPAFVRRHALELVSVANKPLLFYALEALRDAGLEEAIVVVGPDAGEEIREAVRDGSQWGLRVSYVVRRQPGVVRAIRAAEPQLGSASLIVYPANGILLAPLLPLLRSFHRGRLQALLPVRLDDEQERGSVTTLRGARVADELRRMVELDHQLDHEGVYVFGPMIHEAAHRTAPSWRGDYELADVIETMVAAGQRIRARPMEEWVSYDGGARALLHANRLLLDRLVDDRAQAQIADSTIEGRVTNSDLADPMRPRQRDCPLRLPPGRPPGRKQTEPR